MKIYLVRDRDTRLYLHRDEHVSKMGPEDEATIYRSREEAAWDGSLAYDFDEDAQDDFEIVEIDTQAPLQVLKDLFEAGDLEDYFYHIRESEGLGWEGPRMLKWGAACERADKLLKDFKPAV